MREYKKGGYAIIDLASTTIYKDALNAVASNKPVVVYDLPNVYFADTISVVSDDVVITKGGKTLTINDANSVSSEGDIQVKATTFKINVKFDYTFSLGNTQKHEASFYCSKENPTLEDFLKQLEVGDCIVNTYAEKANFISSKSDETNEAYVMYLSSGAYAIYTNPLNTTNVTNYQITRVKTI